MQHKQLQKISGQLPRVASFLITYSIDDVGAESIEMLTEHPSRKAIHFIGQRTCFERVGGHLLFDEMGGGNACLEAALCGLEYVVWPGEMTQ